jgi:hypothetical protein
MDDPDKGRYEWNIETFQRNVKVVECDASRCRFQ